MGLESVRLELELRLEVGLGLEVVVVQCGGLVGLQSEVLATGTGREVQPVLGHPRAGTLSPAEAGASDTAEGSIARDTSSAACCPAGNAAEG